MGLLFSAKISHWCENSTGAKFRTDAKILTSAKFRTGAKFHTSANDLVMLVIFTCLVL